MIAGNAVISRRGGMSYNLRPTASYLQARMEPQAECILVILGATPEGKKELRRLPRRHARERAELA